jgi:hypothetical protein
MTPPTVFYSLEAFCFNNPISKGCAMKKLIVCLLMGLVLGGCSTTSTIGEVENKWGPPARVEQRDTTDIYYYHFYKEQGSAIVRGGVIIAQGTGGWYTVEITTDKAGNILSKKKYWKQPASQERQSPSEYEKNQAKINYAEQKAKEAGIISPADIKLFWEVAKNTPTGMTFDQEIEWVIRRTKEIMSQRGEKKE